MRFSAYGILCVVSFFITLLVKRVPPIRMAIAPKSGIPRPTSHEELEGFKSEPKKTRTTDPMIERGISIRMK